MSGATNNKLFALFSNNSGKKITKLQRERSSKYMFLLQSVAGNSRLQCEHVLRVLATFSLATATSKFLLKGHYVVEQIRLS